MNTESKTIESYLLRLIEDVAVVKTRLDNLDNISEKVEIALDKMDANTIKIEATTIEIKALKSKLSELETRLNTLEYSINEDVKDCNKSYKNSIYAVLTTVIGAIILYALRIN